MRRAARRCTHGTSSKLNRQEHVLLVQHLVVLEAVQQRVGRRIRARREKHSRAGDALRADAANSDFRNPSSGGDEPRRRSQQQLRGRAARSS